MAPRDVVLCRLAAGKGDLLHMPVVGAAAAAKHIDVAEAVTNGPVLLAKFHRVSSIKLGCLVKFGMAAPGGIGANAADAFGPVRLDQSVVEMGWDGHN